MLSKKTSIEIISIVETWSTALLDRFTLYMDIVVPTQKEGVELSKAKKANIILENIQDCFEKQKKALQYIIDQFSRENPPAVDDDPFQLEAPKSIDTMFTESYPLLYNSLKRDGYTIKQCKISKMLPEELDQANTENELISLLDKYSLNISKGHLEQAIKNHSSGDWASANSQFRTFFESLLMEVSNKLIPSKKCTSCGDALQWLANDKLIKPIFLSPELNEVAAVSANGDKTYISGLWKRLHPQGSHPGLSDEEDSTFRYHTLVVFARYILKRLEDR